MTPVIYCSAAKQAKENKKVVTRGKQKQKPSALAGEQG